MGKGESRFRTHTFTHMLPFYRNTPNASSSGTSTGTGYDAQPPSPAMDRHAQQAYYAPRVSPSPQPNAINDGFESQFGALASVPPLRHYRRTLFRSAAGIVVI